jgi:acetyl-CoA carboxylase biotin carboxylase subunit
MKVKHVSARRNMRRILVANRGEIAVRIIRACREMDIETVVAVSDADRESLPARLADRVVCIGPPPSLKSYLDIDTIITAALGTHCDGIHPGYGFLAERPDLPKGCSRHGLIFVGPSAENILQMGDKLYARKMAMEAGIPVIPGSELVRHLDEARGAALKVGYPVLLKAAGGGGGKGMKIAWDEDELKATFNIASAEARVAFGDKRIYLEHYIPNARHIEIQIIGDSNGNVVHCFERDCSLQRRYQKMLEEAPSTAITNELREKIASSALTIARHIGYESVGTVEFILNCDNGSFFFLEMNTRIQVEHPVTEIITGVDLVKEQIRIASGEALGIDQADIKLKGHAIECRINAESASSDFKPCPGTIMEWIPPTEDGVRVDSHCYSGYVVPPYYDSLMAKVITAGKTRADAIKKMNNALKNFIVTGVDTTIPFHQFILCRDEFRSGKVNTRWIEETVMKEYASAANAACKL